MAYEGEDCYMVERTGDTFVVRHFPDREATKPCCRLKLRITDADRARRSEHDADGAIAALIRAGQQIDRHHGR